ncbi:MAG: peptidoglycan DD-metalloendopeptidase family protein [Patescibacteria group bacterium]
MNLRRIITLSLFAPLIAASVFPYAIPASADETSVQGVKAELDDLSDQVKDKQSRIKELDTLIGGYKSRIQEQSNAELTLQNEIALLDNQVHAKELSIERGKTEIEELNLEIKQLEQQITEEEKHISTHKELIAEFLRRSNQSDEVSDLDVLLTQPTLSAFYNRIEEVAQLEEDLGESLNTLKGVKDNLGAAKILRDQHRIEIEQHQKELVVEQAQLEEQRNTKISLVAETENSQEEFERILYELKQQQQITADDISNLQDRLKDTLDSVDESLARGDVLLNWPLKPYRGVSAHFHDPGYPYRKLFEHPGTDIPTPVGTAVHAAAGGYVAWNRTGKQYGNYTMIVHPGGIATIYAHLSKFVAKPDTYVDRGDVIGMSGGRPGDPGAGLSTGPHLHFEVRQNGIPVDAENFLPSVDSALATQ